MTRISHLDTLRALLTLQDPKQFLFFTRTPNGRQAGKEFSARLKERTDKCDKRISLRSYGAQLKAIHCWGKEARPTSRSSISPLSSRTARAIGWCPISNSIDLAQRLAHAQLVVYPDAGHGGIFEFDQQFVEKALGFLDQ